MITTLLTIAFILSLCARHHRNKIRHQTFIERRNACYRLWAEEKGVIWIDDPLITGRRDFLDK